MLEASKLTFVLNDMFPIWFDGHFGTIAGCRLGRLESQPVSWEEINAAIGTVALLVDILADSLKYEFKEYSIVPLGSQSVIKYLKDGSEHELYGDRDGGIVRLFWNHRFDSALVGLLACVKELLSHIVVLQPNLIIPYAIDGEKIGNYSIKWQFATEEVWTKALKFLLTDIKQIVAFVSRTSPHTLPF
jgi:beclin 1